MRKWLQRTVSTAGLALGIAVAAAGAASAEPVAHADDLGVGPIPLSSVTDALSADDPAAALSRPADTGSWAEGPESLPVADGLPVAAGLARGGLPMVGGTGNPVTGGGAGSDMIDGVPLVGDMTGKTVRATAMPGGDRAAPTAAEGGRTDTTERLGMRPDLVGSTLLGKGTGGGGRGDVTRPAEELPVVGLPVVGQLDQLLPAGR